MADLLRFITFYVPDNFKSCPCILLKFVLHVVNNQFSESNNEKNQNDRIIGMICDGRQGYRRKIYILCIKINVCEFNIAYIFFIMYL